MNPEDIPEEEGDESPLAWNLRYQNISVLGAGQIFSILDLNRLTIIEKNAGGIIVQNARDFRALSSARPEIPGPMPTWDNGNGSKTPSMPERRRWQHGGNRA